MLDTGMNSLSAHLDQRVWPAFALDLRSLALFRFLLGLLVAGGALSRLGDPGAFYGLHGLAPPALLAAEGSPWRWSLLSINTSTAFAAALLLVQALAGLALAAGWRTRAATVVAWALWVSLIHRNPWVADAGDGLIAALLFWSLFLPLAGRWSLDATRLSFVPPPRLLSWASAALTLQVLSVFVFTSLQRSAPEWSGLGDPALAGDALQRLLAIDGIGHGLATTLLDHPDTLRGLTVWSHWIGLLAPFGLVLPAFATPAALRLDLRTLLRRLALLLLVLVTLLELVTQALGMLSLATLAGLAALIGSESWEALARRRARAQGTPLQLFHDGRSERLGRLVLGLLLVDAELRPASENRRAATLARANASWVLFDRDQSACLRGGVLLRLLRRSPLLPGLGALADRAALQAPADRLYVLLSARLRPDADLRRRPLPGSVTSWGGRGVGLLLLLVLGWNLLDLGTRPTALQGLLAGPLQLLALDQHWNGFAPAPPREQGHWTAPARRLDGRELDALAGVLPDARWRAFETRAAAPAGAALLPAWAAWICHEANAGLADTAPARLTELKLVRTVSPVGAPSSREQRVAWRQDCPPQTPPP